MAIDRSVGGMKQYLFNLTTSNRYNQLRFKLSRMLFKLGILNEERRKALIRFGNSLKSMAAQQQNIFEGMNIRYFGPIDGHDVKNLARVLRDIKDMQGPKILHLHTIKGKGFGPAEKHATEWHAPGKFDPVTGERFIANTEGMPPLFPGRIRKYTGGTCRSQPENCRCHSRHAQRLFDEYTNGENAETRFRCRHCRRTCGYLLRRDGKRRTATVLQYLFFFYATGA